MTAGDSHPLPAVLVQRLRVRGFRSLADIDICFGRLTVLVGFNASGKSNILDALRFVSDALTTSTDIAVASRGGLGALLHRSVIGNAEVFRMELDLALRLDELTNEVVPATYLLEIGSDPRGNESVLVRSERSDVGDGRASSMSEAHDLVRLRLPVLAAEHDHFARLEGALRSMQFYDFDTAALRALDDASAVRFPQLGPAGEHLGQVLGALAREDASGKERLDAYVAALVPHAVSIDERREGRYSTVQASFRTRGGTGAQSIHVGPEVREEVFLRESLSEGTLRAAGVLAALLQPSARDGQQRLIGIEEPETALHPATVGALYEALDDASERSQVIVTSRSSALLDSEYANIDHLRVVEYADGRTVVGKVDAAGREIVARGLMTLSQLHASGLMRPALHRQGQG